MNSLNNDCISLINEFINIETKYKLYFVLGKTFNWDIEDVLDYKKYLEYPKIRITKKTYYYERNMLRFKKSDFLGCFADNFFYPIFLRKYENNRYNIIKLFNPYQLRGKDTIIIDNLLDTYEFLYFKNYNEIYSELAKRFNKSKYHITKLLKNKMSDYTITYSNLQIKTKFIINNNTNNKFLYCFIPKKAFDKIQYDDILEEDTILNINI